MTCTTVSILDTNTLVDKTQSLDPQIIIIIKFGTDFKKKVKKKCCKK